MLPLQIQPESHIPLYVQLRDQLRALVHSGELRAGDRIPGEPRIGGAAWACTARPWRMPMRNSNPKG